MTIKVLMIERLLDLKSNVQILVVCGRNEILKRRIEEMVKWKSNQIKVFGYTNNIHELMKISSILIGKPGGMTSAEALACGIPMCIVNPIPGQEECNSDHLLEQGTAVKCHDLNTLSFKVQQLLDNPDKLQAMRNNALRFAKPNAARTIVETLLIDNLPANNNPLKGILMPPVMVNTYCK